MKKKLVFIAFVLFCSLASLQYVIMNQVFDTNLETVESNPIDEATFQPVKTEIYSAGDYVVVKKEGKYFVYEKKAKSI